jgi:hypothetical protein
MNYYLLQSSVAPELFIIPKTGGRGYRMWGGGIFDIPCSLFDILNTC